MKRWEKGLQGEEKPKKGSQTSAGRKEPRTREQAQRTQERQKVPRQGKGEGKQLGGKATGSRREAKGPGPALGGQRPQGCRSHPVLS